MARHLQEVAALGDALLKGPCCLREGFSGSRQYLDMKDGDATELNQLSQCRLRMNDDDDDEGRRKEGKEQKLGFHT
jgi:hypothetical protein